MSNADFDTDVLVIGAGPMGATTALALAKLGVEVRMISMFPWVAHTPRAHITSQRTMEVLRDLGVEGEAKKQATPWLEMGDSLLATSLTGTEIARMPSWGSGFERHGDYARHSPCEYLDIPQPRLEPVLVGAASAHGVKTSWNTEFLALDEDGDGVTATLRDVLSGRTYEVRARYLVGADGARSQVAEQIELPFEGHLARAGTIYTRFHADLSQYVAHRPSILHWFFNPSTGFGEIGLGLLRAIEPWDEWIAGWGFDIAGGEPDRDPDLLTKQIRSLIGDDRVEITIHGSSLWYVNQQYATTLSRGRVFCGGDATHRHPPSSGLGLNTCVQDAHNLAWKLAYVLRGYAGAGLLDTYTPERAPVGEQIVLRANQSRKDYAALRECLNTSGDGDLVDNALSRLHAPTPEGVALRDQLDQALRLKDHEFNAEGVEKNQRYTSTAVVADPEVGEEEWPRDRELYLRATTRPGAKIPHAWLVDHRGRRVSSLDVVGDGKFTVLTGLAGRAWQEAATTLPEEFIRTVVVGEGDAQDPYHAWHRIREIHDAGVLLVRPDAVVAWRHSSPVWDVAEATRLLRGAFDQVLSRTEAEVSRA